MTVCLPRKSSYWQSECLPRSVKSFAQLQELDTPLYKKSGLNTNTMKKYCQPGTDGTKAEEIDSQFLAISGLLPRTVNVS